MSWVRYRNRRNGHEGICKEEDFRAARRRTDKLVIIEKFEKNPNSREYKQPTEPKAAIEAKENQKKLDKKPVKKTNNKPKNE